SPYMSSVSRTRPPFPTRRSSDLMRLQSAGFALGKKSNQVFQSAADFFSLIDAGAIQDDQAGRAAGEHAGPAVELVAEAAIGVLRSEEHTSELQSRENLVCRLLLE